MVGESAPPSPHRTRSILPTPSTIHHPPSAILNPHSSIHHTQPTTPYGVHSLDRFAPSSSWPLPHSSSLCPTHTFTIGDEMRRDETKAHRDQRAADLRRCSCTAATGCNFHTPAPTPFRLFSFSAYALLGVTSNRISSFHTPKSLRSGDHIRVIHSLAC